MDNDILRDLELTAKRNALRWHVGHDIFCPVCKAVMDCRRAVEVDLLAGDRLLKSVVTCAGCYEVRVKVNLEGILEQLKAKDLGVRAEVNDGRVLFARKTRKKAA